VTHFRVQVHFQQQQHCVLNLYVYEYGLLHQQASSPHFRHAKNILLALDDGIHMLMLLHVVDTK
jgi:hypothetical protein